MEAPVVNVGIMTEKAISFVFHGEYVHTETGSFLKDEQRVICINGQLMFNGKRYNEIFFEPVTPDSFFELKAVTIGIQFHWERQEDQSFKGALNLIATKKGILAINQVDAEEYLASVISSEMKPTAPKEFLKAHVVISRSWLFSQVEQKREHKQEKRKYKNITRDNEQLIRWYDHEDHELFDVCADDHCQRYQGMTRIISPNVMNIINETRGEVLVEDNKICDTRFSKCCGGVTELFENCWEPVHHPYLTTLYDGQSEELPDLTIEKEADSWIRTSPPAYCNSSNHAILEQVLNDYDNETTDFYRWKVVYTQTQLSELVYRKSGIYFGEILDLVPLERGTSGRIVRLKIIGTHNSFIIGKELEIRRTLSETHLYSSAFVVDKRNIQNNVPQAFVLTGAGWGHGVGLCQIGAAVMSTQGFDYKQILEHYFPGTEIEKRY